MPVQYIQQALNHYYLFVVTVSVCVSYFSLLLANTKRQGPGLFWQNGTSHIYKQYTQFLTAKLPAF